ncbi:MAG: hypothetical protein JWO72_815 [Caulobacteraceae bacterium]|jgi:hypothetical protein|nr:hypothetical protein [Caulobacteraceae bacterium]
MAENAAAILPGDVVRMDQKTLLTTYRHEASEHRRILFERGSGLCPTWQNFTKFLTDLGPAPSTDHLATRLAAGDLTYGPGKVAWIHRDRQPVLVDPLASIRQAPPESHSQRLIIRGTPVEHTALARLLGVPFDAMAVALRNKVSPEALLQQASIAKTLMQAETPWLASERREAFLMAYRMWHMQVRPNYAAVATPAFLFIYSALPNMLKLKRSLTDLDLWDPPTVRGKNERRDHDLWRRYCEAMARVESARVDCSISRHFSLTSELQPMWDRIRAAEERYRTADS